MAVAPLYAWARELLTGTQLADKLRAAPDAPLTDSTPAPDPMQPPPHPGRPVELRMREGGSHALPSAHDLDNPAEVGRLLHAFANHELLAIELMALALLRFPEAPAAYRRGLVAALAEEQTHLNLYLSRMDTLGTRFGEHALSPFFWRVMAPMPTPLDFIAHMSLTFEQANLDFAQHYAGSLRRVGDAESADLLDRVYADEIGHVKLGAVWFERWRERGPSLFEAHQRALRAPMTPRRARGIGFARNARQRAGLPAEYIDELACFEASRGRVPSLHLFDPSTELQFSSKSRYTPDANATKLAADLETLPMFIAGRQNMVAVGQQPRIAFQAQLSAAGFELPQWLESAPNTALNGSSVPNEQLEQLCPWGWSPPVRERVKGLLDAVKLSPPPAESDAILHAKTTWFPLRARVVQELGAAWVDEPAALGSVQHGMSCVLNELERLARAGYPVCVLKAPYGTAGRNAQRVRDGVPNAAQHGWIASMLKAQGGALIVEPWLDRVCDLSLQLEVSPAGVPRYDELHRFICDRRGQYLGAVLGPLMRNVPSELARLFNGEGRDPRRLARVSAVVAQHVAAVAHQHGYHGRLGIDAMVFRTGDGSLRLRPMVEVNARPTLGCIVLGVARQLAANARGLWVVLPLSDLGGTNAFDALASASAVLPTLVGDGRLHQGVVATTDPQRAQAVLSVALVGHDPAQVHGALKALSPKFARKIEAAQLELA